MELHCEEDKPGSVKPVFYFGSPVSWLCVSIVFKCFMIFTCVLLPSCLFKPRPLPTLWLISGLGTFNLSDLCPCLVYLPGSARV